MTVVTVYVTRESYQEYRASLRGRADNTVFNPALSVFKTDFLRRFGTGRIRYELREYAACDKDCDPQPQQQREPCLAVTRYYKPHSHLPMHCDAETLRCNYPRCRTMISNDEMCRAIDAPFDARQYRSSDRPDLGYLPLGPRLDAWEALKEAARGTNPAFFRKPPSRRRFAFNAVFSVGTNAARRDLASIVERMGGPTGRRLAAFAHITDDEVREGAARHGQLSADDYVDVLLDSAFTLCPAGHNPECYRAYEAVEAGSVPVFLKEDLSDVPRHPNPRDRPEWRNVGHPCRDAMGLWRDAPGALVLDEWDGLHAAIEGRIADPTALDAAMGELAAWYDGRMRGAASRFEDFLLLGDAAPP